MNAARDLPIIPVVLANLRRNLASQRLTTEKTLTMDGESAYRDVCGEPRQHQPPGLLASFCPLLIALRGFYSSLIELLIMGILIWPNT